MPSPRPSTNRDPAFAPAPITKSSLRNHRGYFNKTVFTAARISLDSVVTGEFLLETVCDESQGSSKNFPKDTQIACHSLNNKVS